MRVIAKALTSLDEVRDAASLDGPATLVLVFGSRQRLASQNLLGAVTEAFPTSVVVGCSTAGHFIGDTLVDEPVLAAVAFEHSRLQEASATLDETADSYGAGAELGRKLAAPDLQAVLVLSDGTRCNGSALVDGLMSSLPAGTEVFGGLAADGDAFIETAVLDSGGFRSGAVVGVGFFGDRLSIRTGSGGGWDTFGPERTITAAEGSTLFELDGQPALDLYKRYLSERAAELPGSALLFPLAIRHPDSDYGSHVVRTVLGIDDDANSMTFAGDIPLGWRAQLMRANFDALVDGAADSVGSAAGSSPTSGDAFCLGVSCVGRRLVLGSRAEDELEAVVDGLAGPDNFVGFYSYGELGPGAGGNCELHNQTITLALISEP